MSTRTERIATLIKKEVSEIIREKVNDPRIGFVSITGVDVSPDLENANIYVSILGSEKQKKDSMHGLLSATGFIRGELGSFLDTRTIPRIEFVRDDSIERGSRILSLMSKLEKDEKHTRRNKKSAKKR